jgi:hypothetical protein
MTISPIGSIISGPLSLIFGLSGLYFGCAIIGILLTVASYYLTDLRHIDYDHEFELTLEEDISGKVKKK